VSQIKQKYSNVIFFGDSQTDIGNVPTSSVCRKENEYRLLTSLCYVPISNPVDNKKLKIYQVPGTVEEQFRFNYPDIQYYSQFQHHPPLLNNFERKSSSIGWAHYFIENAVNAGLITEHNLYNWSYAMEYGLEKRQSNMNYSWVSALSNKKCHRLDFWIDSTPFLEPESTTEQILKRQKSFRDNPSDFDKLIKLAVPASGRQVELFKEDLKNSKIEVDDRTLYIIWTGANDTALAFSQTFKLKSFLKNNIFRAVKSVIPDEIAGDNKSSVLNSLIQSYAKPKHIIVVSQYNVGMIPGMMKKFNLKKRWQKKIFTYLTGLLINTFNRKIKKRISILQSKHAELSIEFINIKDVIDKLTAKNGPFYEKFGIAFIDENMSRIEKGQGVDAEGYMYWDSEHLASSGQQVIANEVLKHIQNYMDKSNN